MPEYSIIIPTVSTNSDLGKNIDSIADAFNTYVFEIIVVNDNKNKQLQLALSTSNCIVLNNPGKGAASARNFGAGKAKYDTLIFIDDDMVVEKNGLQEFLSKVGSLSPNSILLPNWTYPHELTQLCKRTAFGRFLLSIRNNSLAGYMNLPEFNGQDLIPHNAIASYFLCINKTTFFNCGAYNETIPFAGFEDHDLSVKLSKNGVKVFIYPAYTVWHNEKDKINLSNWLQRKKSGAVTRRKAFDLGYRELELKFGRTKALLFELLFPFENILIWFINFIGKASILDFVSFAILKYLIACNIYRGYNLK